MIKLYKLSTMFEEPLHLYPIEKWPELEQIFESDLPRGICGLLLLQTQRYFLQRGLDHGCKIYCPYGDGRNGLVAVNLKKGLNEIVIQCPTENTSKLEEALKNTNIVDWREEIEIPFVPNHVMECIKRVIQNSKVEFIHVIPTTTYVLDKSSPLFNVTLPPGFTFDLLSLEHVHLLDSTWPHRFDGCNFYFELIIKAKLGYGLFKEKQLVSWVLLRETGALLHLFTVQEERRKGYGEIVLKLMSNVLLKDGKYIVAHCAKVNVNAAKLYQKLNFLHMIDIEWCTLTGRF